MITLEAALQAHLDGRVTSLAVCWKLVRRDDEEVFGTEHDGDIVITTGVYQGTYRARTGLAGTSSNVKSSSDLSVDNLDVTGAFRRPGDLSIFSISAADIEAGLLDNADIVVFLVNWQDPDAGQRVLRKGTIGNVTRTSEGQYRTEMRGLTQALSQTIVRTYGTACDAELFDARCGLSAAAFTYNGAVNAVTSRRQFDVTWGTTPSPRSLINRGRLTFLTGNNAGYSMEIKDAQIASPNITLYLPMPVDIEAGDQFEAIEGCDKTRARCVEFGNIVNFRGHGVLVPGQNEVLKVGGQ